MTWLDWVGLVGLWLRSLVWLGALLGVWRGK
jgi:hypothetical protein